MRKYELLEIQVCISLEPDVVAKSPNESADDLGGWDNDWFN